MSDQLPPCKKRRISEKAFAWTIDKIKLLLFGMLRLHIQTAIPDLATIVLYYLEGMLINYHLHNNDYINVQYFSNKSINIQYHCKWFMRENDSIVFTPSISNVFSDLLLNHSNLAKITYKMIIKLKNRYLTTHNNKLYFKIKFGIIETPKFQSNVDFFEVNNDVFDGLYSSYYWEYCDFANWAIGFSQLIKNDNDFEKVFGSVEKPKMEFKINDSYQICIDCVRNANDLKRYYLYFVGSDNCIWNSKIQSESLSSDGKFKLDFEKYNYSFGICAPRTCNMVCEIKFVKVLSYPYRM